MKNLFANVFVVALATVKENAIQEEPIDYEVSG